MRSNTLFATFAVLALVACSRQPEGHQAVVAHPIDQRPTTGAAAPQPPPPPSPPSKVETSPVPPALAVHRLIDVSSADAFLSSLRAIEASESPDKVERLRGALTILQLQASTRIAAMARGNPTLKAENLSDQQLIQITFGDLNGMNIDQAIALGQQVAKGLLPRSGASPGSPGS